MRRQRFYWTFLVLAIVLTGYGGFTITYNLRNGKDATPLAIIFLVIGLLMLLLFLALLLASLIQRKKANRKHLEEEANKKEEPKIEEKPEPKTEPTPEPEPKPEPKSEPAPTKPRAPRDEVVYAPRRPSREFNGGSAYIKQVGYGSVLRVENEEILDMRSNTYYRIEGNFVKRSGAGPVFEINRNTIKAAYGGPLYEISGSSVSRVFGGYFASISGGYLKTNDLSEEYEISGSLNRAQQLAVVAILFGTY